MIDTLALAVDLGGTKVEPALVDAKGTVLAGSRVRRPTGPTLDSEGVAAAVRAVVEGSLSTLCETTRLVGIGVGSAGPIVESLGLVSPVRAGHLAR